MPTPIFIDELLIVPVTIGEALTEATRVLGVLAQQSTPVIEAQQIEALQAAQHALLAAIGGDEAPARAAALQGVQQQLAGLYDAIKNDEAARAAFGFPAPEFIEAANAVEVVDVQKVSVTFTLQGRQMLTSIAFPRAAGAKAYWLHEVRHFAAKPEERVEDPILESHFPLFDRVRLAPGTRILRIKSRNPSSSAISEEFTIEVPVP